MIRQTCPRIGCTLAVCVLIVAFVIGCAEKKSPPLRLNAPPQGRALAHPPWTSYFTYHNDQGMMADMSITDIHFVPHLACLSGTGEARLERYAELLAATGGTIRYDPATTDRDLIEARVEVARRFIAQVVPTPKEIEVVLRLSGGRGMSAKEALSAEAVAKQPEPRITAYKLNESSNSKGD